MPNYVKACDLEDGDLITYRDRENPNMRGKVSIIDGKPYKVHALGKTRIDDYSPFFCDMVVVESFDNIEHIDEREGLDRYHRDSPDLRNTNIGRSMERMSLPNTFGIPQGKTEFVESLVLSAMEGVVSTEQEHAEMPENIENIFKL